MYIIILILGVILLVLWGSIVNALAIILGAILGTIVNFPENVKNSIMHVVSLVVIIIGISMGIDSKNILIPFASLILGSIVGELLNIESKIENLGQKLQKVVGSKEGSIGTSRFTQGFLTTTLVYCVGAMAVIGGLNSGLQGNHSVLYAKSMLDGISAIFFSATFGMGVAFSALAVLIYQGLIAILATFVAPVLSAAVLLEITATGGILILAIGLNMLGLSKISVGNMLPGILIVVILANFFSSLVLN